MVEVLHQLCRDHVYLRDLLDVIDDQIRFATPEEPTDYRLLHAISEYILHYPTMVHEPKEVLIYSRILLRKPRAAERLQNWAAEHRQLAALSKRFAAAIYHARRNPDLPQEWVRQTADGYVRAYRRHIELEEIEFFPGALRHLFMDDWLEIDAEVTKPDHPVFGAALQCSFGALRRDIARMREQVSITCPPFR